MQKYYKNLVILTGVLLISACAGSPARRAITPQATGPSGYEYIAKSSSGHKWYVAPASKANIQIEGRNPVTGKVEVNTFTAMSIFIASPYGGDTEYKVEAFACGLLPGTFAKQRGDNRGWDDRYTTDAYGTIRWQIWNYVCKK